MEKSQLKKFFSHFILFFAITMMVGSALISYFLTRQNDLQISSLNMEMENKQNLIRDVWNNIGKKESRADIAVLVLMFSDRENKDIAELREYYLSEFSVNKTNATVLDILKTVADEKKSGIEYINDLYFEETVIKNKISNIEQSNKLYSNIAFFLQIFSLLLVIVKKDMP